MKRKSVVASTVASTVASPQVVANARVPRAFVVLSSQFSVVPGATAPSARSRTLTLERAGKRYFGKVLSPHERKEQSDLLVALWHKLERSCSQYEQSLFPRPEGMFAHEPHEDRVVVIVTEHAPGMDLFEYIKLKENGVPENVLRAVFTAVLRALFVMHELGFVHGDVKPENVMVDVVGEEVRRVCLVDFGFMFRVDAPPTFKRMGTMLYTAPEMIAGEEGRYSRALDVWAVGATLLTAFTRKSVGFFRDATLDTHKLELATSSCPPALASLIARLMAPRESRISIAEALESEWLMLTPRGRSSAAASLYRMWRRPLGTLDTSAAAAATS